MGTVNFSISLSGGGISISRGLPRTADGVSSRDSITIPVGKAGTLTTRTDNNTGTITMSAGGHGITTGQIVDVYWSGGVQYAVTVGTVATNSVPIDLGAGDNLPSASTAVVVAPRVQVNADIDGDLAAIIGLELGFSDATASTKAHALFLDASSDIIAEIDITANSPQVWDVTGGSANPFAGDPIMTVFVSNGSTTAAGTLKMLWAADATP